MDEALKDKLKAMDEEYGYTPFSNLEDGTYHLRIDAEGSGAVENSDGDTVAFRMATRVACGKGTNRVHGVFLRWNGKTADTTKKVREIMYGNIFRPALMYADAEMVDEGLAWARLVREAITNEEATEAIEAFVRLIDGARVYATVKTTTGKDKEGVERQNTRTTIISPDSQRAICECVTEAVTV